MRSQRFTISMCIRRSKVGLPVMMALLCSSCLSKYLPEDLDAYDKDAAFTTTTYSPTLGRNNLISNNFNLGNSTNPLTFTLLDVRHADGTPAPELTENFKVRVWKTPYLGTEKTLKEIEDKRTYENRPLFQVRKHSGEIVLWANARSSFVRCSPDEGYLFDVRAENSGGWNEYKDLQLKPIREQDYEPNNMNTETGATTQDYVNPDNVTNMFKDGLSFYAGRMQTTDVKVFMRENKDDTSKEPSLTFRFMTKDLKPIDPANFNTTDWDKLVHGFDREMTKEYVKYKVAYPVPLRELPTEYTNKEGNRAHVRFQYDRLMFGTRRVRAMLDYTFAIYKEGHWEVIFVFDGGTPAFK